MTVATATVLGVWIVAAAMWHAKEVPGFWALSATAGAAVTSYILM